MWFHVRLYFTARRKRIETSPLIYLMRLYRYYKAKGEEVFFIRKKKWEKMTTSKVYFTVYICNQHNTFTVEYTRSLQLNQRHIAKTSAGSHIPVFMLALVTIYPPSPHQKIYIYKYNIRKIPIPFYPRCLGFIHTNMRIQFVENRWSLSPDKYKRKEKIKGDDNARWVICRVARVCMCSLLYS